MRLVRNRVSAYGGETWIIAKLEINRRGSNRRFIVTNLSGDPQGIYHGFYVQRGDVPERPIGQLKNGLHADRLSCHGFSANSFRLLEHTVAYATFPNGGRVVKPHAILEVRSGSGETRSTSRRSFSPAAAELSCSRMPAAAHSSSRSGQ